MGQSNWFWKNGTMITDPTYPQSKTSVCEQMTWPLTYDDGINLKGEFCGKGKAYYICQLPVMGGKKPQATTFKLQKNRRHL